MNLEEVYEQIDTEAKEIVKNDTGYDPDTDEELGQYKPKLVDFQLRVRYYKKGASPYALKWQEAEQKAEIAELKLESKRNVIDALQRQIVIDGDKIERYKKALNWVKQYALNCQNNRTIPNPLVIYSTIDKALTPKTTADEH